MPFYMQLKNNIFARGIRRTTQRGTLYLEYLNTYGLNYQFFEVAVLFSVQPIGVMRKCSTPGNLNSEWLAIFRVQLLMQ